MNLSDGIYPYTSNDGSNTATDFLAVINGACCAYDLYYTASYGFWNAYISGDGKIRSVNDYDRIEDAVIASSGIQWDPIVVHSAAYPIPSEWDGCFPEPENDGRCPVFTEWAKCEGIISD